MTAYIEGQLIRLTASFADHDGVATDPTTVTLHIETPSHIKTSYIFGTDAGLIKDSAGNYHYDILPSAPGFWYYRFVGTGAVTDASQGKFLVTRAKPS